MELAIAAACLLVGFGLGVFFHAKIQAESHALIQEAHDKLDAILARIKVKR